MVASPPQRHPSTPPGPPAAPPPGTASTFADATPTLPTPRTAMGTSTSSLTTATSDFASMVAPPPPKNGRLVARERHQVPTSSSAPHQKHRQPLCSPRASTRCVAGPLPRVVTIGPGAGGECASDRQMASMREDDQRQTGLAARERDA